MAGAPFVQCLLAWILGLATAPGATQVTLCSPITTVVPYLGAWDGGALVLTAELIVPGEAPADLGVGAYVSDRHGAWYQTCQDGHLAPGHHRIRFSLGPADPLVSEPMHHGWSPGASALMAKTGIFFYSAAGSRTEITITSLAVAPLPDVPAAGATVKRLLDLRLGDGTATVAAGERWTIQVRPDPMPANPDDPRQFTLAAVITGPDGVAMRIPGFSYQAMTLDDRGDREDATPHGPGIMQVRFRARQPGRYQVSLEASWEGGPTVVTAVPALTVTGQPWDCYARVDPLDPRFFAVGGDFWWPIGLNVHSVNDVRSQENLGTRLTTDRRAAATIAQLRRLAAGGGTAAEIWLASWNLGLEWRADWPGFAGRMRYSQEQAARLDAVLDAAWALGVRVNLVIANHGQISARMDSEWRDNPWNRATGGPIADPALMFSAPEALDGQEAMRRYLIARYADHPAIMGWKLWSEINLTAGNQDAQAHQTMKRWHEFAAARWRALDAYAHPITTHWAGDYRSSDWDIAGLPGMAYLCIDAYHGGPGGWGDGGTLAALLSDSVLDSRDGLARFRKPVLVTEYGGSAMGASDTLLRAEHASASWAALVSGHGGAPMLWWFEWVDQQGLYQPFRAIARFIAGEDLRGQAAHSVLIATLPDQPRLWSHAWSRAGRMLGYLLDTTWQGGGSARSYAAGEMRLVIGDQVAPGTCHLEWWDADSGELVESRMFEHPGGMLALTVPGFTRHLAFKLARAP
jgi:hypothetical protein